MNEIMPINLYTDSFYDKSLKVSLNGFIFKYDNKYHLISIHHNLPINKVEYNNDPLNIKINSNWSEILILDLPNNYIDYKINKLYQNKLPLIDQMLQIKTNNNTFDINVIGYDFMPFDNLPNSPKTIYIKCKIYGNNNYSGLSGSPVFYNNILVGIMSKVNTKTSIAYIIPFYIVIKNLLKNDNDNVYKLNSSIKLKKIGFYQIKSNDTIYHKIFKYYIPIDNYILIEGDTSIRYNFISDTSIRYNFISDTNDIVYWDNIKEITIHDKNIYNIDNKYKVTNRLLSLLNKINIDKTILIMLLQSYLNNIYKSSDSCKDIYINEEFKISNSLI